MSEMINIGALAEHVSGDILSKLGWEMIGPPNESWKCAIPEIHNKKDHPTDVTFVYQDPYTLKNVHLLTDLKSYAAGSINNFPLKVTLEALALSVECAKNSEEWKTLYLKPGADYEIQGLLFIYNHDAYYDRNFGEALDSVMEEGLAIPKGVRLNVMGPEDIWYLGDVVNDLAVLMSEEKILPGRKNTPFHYHSYARELLSNRSSHPAGSIDTLMGRYQILTYVQKNKGAGSTRGLLLYYKGAGKDIKEFILLFDMLREYGLLDSQDEIFIRCPAAASIAAVNFKKAQSAYGEYPGNEMPETLSKIKFSSVANITPRISQYEIALKGT